MNYTKTPWNHLDKLTPDQWIITRIVGNLDDIATGYETRWGAGKLQALAAPDLLAKWDRQMEKLNSAIEREHPSDVLELAFGTRRAWEALEAAALAAGHTSLDPNAWEVVATDGYVYRVFRTHGLATGENGISVQELVSFYHSARIAAMTPPEHEAMVKKPEPTFNDGLPF